MSNATKCFDNLKGIGSVRPIKKKPAKRAVETLPGNTAEEAGELGIISGFCACSSAP